MEKKRHTLKNLLVSEMDNKIIYLSYTYEGSVHDKAICDEQELDFRKKVGLWIDSGFEGFNPENATVHRPKKKPKNRELTAEEKKQNQTIAKVRIKVEHAIGQCKVFRIVKEEIRAYKDDFRDLAMLLACGLANFKIIYL